MLEGEERKKFFCYCNETLKRKIVKNWKNLMKRRILVKISKCIRKRKEKQIEEIRNIER